jgi:uncharacterized protein YegL
MTGEPIEELQMGVRMFFDAIRQDEVAQYSAEIAIITFGGEVEKALDFYAINRQQIPKLCARGLTPMGGALDLALNLLEARKGEYSRAGVDYYQPWLVLMTDSANMDELAQLSPNRPPLKLKGLNFREFFLWLSQSVSRVSQSIPGESVVLDTDGIKSWGQV